MNAHQKVLMKKKCKKCILWCTFAENYGRIDLTIEERV